ncbi:hypothetical protein CR513_15069, partial [Mucuna pruriens]
MALSLALESYPSLDRLSLSLIVVCLLNFTKYKYCHFHWLFNVSLAVWHFQNAQLMNMFYLCSSNNAGPRFRSIGSHFTGLTIIQTSVFDIQLLFSYCCAVESWMQTVVV